MDITLQTTCNGKFCGECAAADYGFESSMHWCRQFSVPLVEVKEPLVLRCDECLEKFGKESK